MALHQLMGLGHYDAMAVHLFRAEKFRTEWLAAMIIPEGIVALEIDTPT